MQNGVEAHAVAYYAGKLRNLQAWLALANQQLGSDIVVSAVLLDQEPGWAVTVTSQVLNFPLKMRQKCRILPLISSVFDWM